MSIRSLKGIGEKIALKYEKLKIKTIYDLLMYFPKRYIDCSKEKMLDEVEDGEKAPFKLKILQKLGVKKIRNKTICKMIAVDRLNCAVQIIYFNNVYVFSCLEEGKTYIFFGKVEKNVFDVKMVNPTILKKLEIIPKYSLTKGITNSFLINSIKRALDVVSYDENSLPSNLVNEYNLISFKKAVEIMHSPKSVVEYRKARRSLVFFELLCWQVGLLKLGKGKKKQNLSKIDSSFLQEVIDSLPFKLTNAQKRVVDEIVLDCCCDVAMNRLVQGDVGSGKTIVCVLVSYLFVKNKEQVALMAPTDILSRQHYKTFKNFLEKFGVRVSLLVGGLKPKEKDSVLEKIEMEKLTL